MKSIKILRIVFIIGFLTIVYACTDRESTNPFDTNCPKEFFTPSDFKAEQEGTTVKLSWKQTNTQISGFVISRNENDGAMIELARIEKTVLTWNDDKITGGKKYGYQLVAYAGENLSNPQKVSITPVTGAVVITFSSVSDLTPFFAVLGGNVTDDGGAAVTERGICFGTSQNPTISNVKVVAGNGPGEFNGTITNLNANTTYYAKAYAINSQGTTYGNQITFSTPQLQLTVTPAIYDVPKESGSRVFTVTSNIEWQVASDQSWCKPNITSGKGNSPVITTFEANTAVGQRSAALAFSAVGVSNQIVVVTQAGTEPPVLSITPVNRDATNAAGTTTFAITSNVSWTATSDQTWCTIANTSGVGNGTLTINYEANTTNLQRIANLAITGLGLSAKTVTLTQQSALPTEGLVAWYPFNGNANDESGNGNNCTVHNVDLTADRKSNQSKAYSFNGSNAYIIANNNNVGNFSGNTTFCLWVNVATNGGGFIMDKDNYDYYFFNADANGVNFLISFDWNYSSSAQIITKAQMENQWNFLVVVIENLSYKIYANGKYIKTENIPQNAVINTQNLSIGRQGYWAANYFSGKIDDIRFYNRALTEQEILQLYNE
jgi:hypothetical protein